MRVVDLFAGAGGMSQGLSDAGCEVIAAVEWDKDAAATYRAMIGEHMHERDIREINGVDLPACDLLHASPPCQGFSYAGKRDKNDPRNDYWYEVLRIVSELRPAWVTMENVRGMLTMGEDKAVIVAFRAIGYELTPHLLCAADYGVPQRRYRVFYVGNRLGMPNPVPPASHAQPPRHLMLGLQPWVTVRQALNLTGGPHPISDAVSSTIRFQGGGNDLSKSYVVRPQGWVPNVPLDEAAPTIQGGGSDTGGAEPVRHRLVMSDQRNPSKGRSAYYDGANDPARSELTEPGNIADLEIELDVPAPTVKGRSEGGGPAPTRHPRKAEGMKLRRLTVRECATLQGFPEWFEFSGGKTSQYRQVGNAVPPGMGEAIARAVMATSAREAA